MDGLNGLETALPIALLLATLALVGWSSRDALGREPRSRGVRLALAWIAIFVGGTLLMGTLL